MTLYLVNAPTKGKPRARKARKRTTTTRRTRTMAARTRDARGRFKKGGGGARRSSPRRRRSTTSTTRRRTTYRRNPPTRRRTTDILGRVQGGLVDGLQVLLGEAAARMIPTLFKLPTAGPVGIGVQLASAVAMGMVAEKVVSKDAARMLVAGGVSAPLQSLVIQYQVPFLAPALQPGTVGAYPQGGRLIGYPQRGPAPARLNGYPNSGALQVAPFVPSAGAPGAGSF